MENASESLATVRAHHSRCGTSSERARDRPARRRNIALMRTLTASEHTRPIQWERGRGGDTHLVVLAWTRKAEHEDAEDVEHAADRLEVVAARVGPVREKSRRHERRTKGRAEDSQVSRVECTPDEYAWSVHQT